VCCWSCYIYSIDEGWEILARILSQVRQDGILVSITDVSVWRAEDIRSFARRVIHEHPTITSFADSENFPYESFEALYSALATLPDLESIVLERHTRPEDESTLAHPESLAELLRVPSLRFVVLDGFDFTPALCQATANALMDGTAITNPEFKNCSFSAGECAVMMATGLSRNTSVSDIEVVSEHDDGVIFDALAAALPSNSTLRDLFISGAPLPPVFLALGKNTGRKTVSCNDFGSMDESLCRAMEDGLWTNATLESLKFNDT
jgi:hypothetical protein